MAHDGDVVDSSLLCTEDSSAVFDDCLGDVVEDNEFNSLLHLNQRSNFENQSFDELVLPAMSEEFLASMLKTECQQLLDVGDYFKRFQTGDLIMEDRIRAVEWIGKVNEHYGFGPLCAYLSVNYLDRFLSAYEIPKGEPWKMQLLAVACVSLAAKMEETEVPLSLDLQVDSCKCVFEAATIKRMEIMVLRSLKWRMRAITPFSFIDHFICKINDDQFPPPSRPLFRSVQLISATAKGIDYLKHRPSEIAAAVALLSLKETQTVNTEKALSALSQYVEKGSVLKCMELMREAAFDKGFVMQQNSVALPVPRSPIGVLDVASLSFKSDGSTIDSRANSANSTPEFKRRRLNGPSGVELLQ